MISNTLHSKLLRFPRRQNLACAMAWMLMSMCAVAADDPQTRVYTAAEIITLNTALPSATAVAVRHGKILAVGTLEFVRNKIGTEPFVIDGRFDKNTLVPGFVDPHFHSIHSAMLLPMARIPDPRIPGEHEEGSGGIQTTIDLAKMKALADRGAATDQWLDFWDYDSDYHGPLSRSDLDRVSTQRPILVWHRSLAAIQLNTRAVETLQLDENKSISPSREALETGYFDATIIAQLRSALINRLLTRERHVKGLQQGRQTIAASGVTTIADAGFASLGFDQEYRALLDAGFDSATTPFRTVLMINGSVVGEHMGHRTTAKWIASLPERGSHRVRLRGDALMLELDGIPCFPTLHSGCGAATQSAEVRAGYLERFEQAVPAYWRRGFQIHVQVHSDWALNKTLSVLSRLQVEMPRQEHDFTLHVACDLTRVQGEQLASLGGLWSGGPHCVGGPFVASTSVGGITTALTPSENPFSLYSDFPFAHLRPLERVEWQVARADSDRQFSERTTLTAALRAVTIDAAAQLHMDDEIGSIEAGKSADFTALQANPYSVPIANIGEIEISGVVFEGEAYPR